MAIKHLLAVVVAVAVVAVVSADFGIVKPIGWKSWDTKLFQNQSSFPAGGIGSKGMPSARSSGCGFIDSQGNFYLFGGATNGLRIPGYFADMWKFNSSAKTSAEGWTWVYGSSSMDWRGTWPYTVPFGQNPRSISSTTTAGLPATGIIPEARFSQSCVTDLSYGTLGRVFLFGGAGGSSYQPDLWEFNIDTKAWTLWATLKGVRSDNTYDNLLGTYHGTKNASANNKAYLGGRVGHAMWIDSTVSKTYIFGGSGPSLSDTNQHPLHYFGDTWTFTFATKTWNWILGRPPTDFAYYDSEKATYPASFPGVGAPGARAYMQYCANADNTLFYMYGGVGNYGTYADLWVFDPNTSVWTCLWAQSPVPKATSTSHYQSPNFTRFGGAPGGLDYGIAWIDGDGNFNLFGGLINVNSQFPVTDNHWRFSMVTKTWTWMSGAGTKTAAGVYPTTTPGQGSMQARRDIQYARTLDGQVYIAGGFGGANWTNIMDTWVSYQTDV